VTFGSSDAVIHFGYEGRIKTARRRRTKNALQHFVHLRCRDEELKHLSSLRTLVSATPPGNPIFATTTREMERWLQTLPVEPAVAAEFAGPMDQGLMRSHYTCHSLKVGTLRTLAELGEAGKVEAATIGLLAKHKADSTPLPKQTVAYLRRVPAMTRMGPTGAATLLL
jgi:hypothetical protein